MARYIGWWILGGIVVVVLGWMSLPRVLAPLMIENVSLVLQDADSIAFAKTALPVLTNTCDEDAIKSLIHPQGVELNHVPRYVRRCQGDVQHWGAFQKVQWAEGNRFLTWFPVYPRGTVITQKLKRPGSSKEARLGWQGNTDDQPIEDRAIIYLEAAYDKNPHKRYDLELMRVKGQWKIWSMEDWGN